MGEVEDALEKYQGLVPLVYDIETMGLAEARPQDMYYAVYLKREADKVIAELKSQKAQAEDDCAYWKTMSRKCADDNEVMAKQRAEAFKKERHHKYKRCLAMAERCKDYIDNQVQCDEHDDWLIITEYWERWHKRWLELAEKFKEAK